MKKISETILTKIKKSTKKNIFGIHDIKHLQNTKSELNQIIEKINSNNEYDPVLKIYIITQNILSVFIEELLNYKEFNKFNTDVLKYEDKYMPDGPPMSPLTRSYFTYWLFFDYIIGKTNETIGSIFFDISKTSQIDGDIVNAVKNLNNSRMGFYEVIEINNAIITLKEIITNNIYHSICPAGYKGRINDIIFARIVPNLFDVNGYSIILTTPYIIINYNKSDWLSFFYRQGINENDTDYESKLDKLLKYEINEIYWHEYIMDAYVNHTNSCIYLTGIPDVKGTKPHER